MYRDSILGKLKPYENKSVKLSDNQKTTDIINEILNAHKKYASEYDKISDQFWRGNIKDSCIYIYNFLKNNVKYKIEPDTRQSVKSPAAIISTGNNGGYNDCKHYSLFFAGLLDSWKRKGKNIDWCYRFANYKMFSSNPHHVFVVVNPNKSEIWCDAVLDNFNEKKQYINKIDKKVNMAMYSISGVGGCDNNNIEMFGIPVIAGRKTRAERKQRRQTKRTARRSGENCKGRTGSKIALFVPRKAFLFLVRLNFKKLALKLNAGLNDPAVRSKILEKWCSLGGKADLLKSTVAKAINKYKRKHPDYIGAAPVGLAAALASAQPIIIAMAPILALVSKLLPAGSKGAELTELASEGAQSLPAGEYSEGETAGDIKSMLSNRYLLYAAVGLGAVLFIMRKK